MAASGTTRKVAAGVALVVALAMGVTALIGPMAGTSGGGGKDSRAEYCAGLQTYVTQLNTFQDPSDAAKLDQLIADGNNLSKLAPGELTDDWGLLVQYLEQIKATGGDQAKLQQLNASMDPGIAQALQAIPADGQQNCTTPAEDA
ncbi:hypothetical protein [Kribbella sp. NPDC051770]|uniref:hypothetical protein n=1 Tax=Kribbella sp. NPDC051770 TaxID=3155413 RepID=UPI0034261DDE